MHFTSLIFIRREKKKVEKFHSNGLMTICVYGLTYMPPIFMFN